MDILPDVDIPQDRIGYMPFPSNGICGRLLNFLKTLYENSSCQMKLGNTVCEGFPVHRGLRQG